MVDPKIIIRMGSHAEKDYIEKTARYLDGIIANLPKERLGNWTLSDHTEGYQRSYHCHL